jgi:hypothetical protein
MREARGARQRSRGFFMQSRANRRLAVNSFSGVLSGRIRDVLIFSGQNFFVRAVGTLSVNTNPNIYGGCGSSAHP